MPVEKRSHKLEKLARIYDEQIAPVWGSRFAKMLLRNLALPERGQILDVSCGTGFPLVEVLRRKGDGARVIAIDASSAMLDVARRKVAGLGAIGKKGVFFRTESATPRLSFADEVYDLVLCNLGLSEMPNAASALADFARVCKLGGEVRCTLPLQGTWLEFHDIYREVLVKHDRHDALDRLDRHLESYPSVDDCAAWMRAAGLVPTGLVPTGLVPTGLVPTVEIEEFTLLFKSSREFFFAPVVEFGPLPAWKAIAGSGQELQDIFWYIKESIDAYFGERAFQVTVKAGCLVGRKVDRETLDDVAGGRIELVSESLAPHLADGSVRNRSGGNRSVSNQDAGTAEVDVRELLEVEGSQNAVDYAELALDAFTAGKPRPRYLADAAPADDGSEDPTGGMLRWDPAELAPPPLGKPRLMAEGSGAELSATELSATELSATELSATGLSATGRLMSEDGAATTDDSNAGADAADATTDDAKHDAKREDAEDDEDAEADTGDHGKRPIAAGDDDAS